MFGIANETNYFAAAKTHTDHAPITTQTGNATHLVAPMLNTATLVIVLKASPRRRLGIHAPSTDLRLARLGARLARLGVQPPHLARRPPYRLENRVSTITPWPQVGIEEKGQRCYKF